MSMKIAIVGGIGSGKSEALAVARALGMATLSADEINGELLESAEYIARLAELFPFAVKDGRADRATLARHVFSDDGEREKLNALAHPLILEKIRSDMRDPLVAEVPVFDKDEAEGIFDVVVLISASEAVRRQRLEKRGMSAEDISARMRAQDPDALLHIADYVLPNEQSADDFRKRVESLLKKLTETD